MKKIEAKKSRATVPLIRFLAFSFFLPFPRAIPHKLRIRFPCISVRFAYNALCTWAFFADLDLARLTGFTLRESSSRLGLHNNALCFLSLFCRPWSSMTDRISLRESTSRLGLHNNALCFPEPFLPTLVWHDWEDFPLFLLSVWLPSSFLSPGPGRFPASSYK